MRTMVESEFAPLHRVVVARSEVIFPSEAERPEYLPEESFAHYSQFLGRSLAEAMPERQAAWEAEREAFVDVLERHGVEVLRPRPLTEAERAADPAEGAANLFVRDPFFTVGNAIIEASFFHRYRRDEVLPVRQILMDEARGEDVLYFATPHPSSEEVEGTPLGPFLEGGDVLILGNRVFVGMSGHASNEVGCEWLRRVLDPLGVEVQGVPLTPGFLHLDCALGLVREGLMVVCPEAFPEGIPTALREWDRVEVDAERSALLAVNGLPLSPEVYVTDPAFADIVGVPLERRGVTVEYVDFSITRSLGGSFRCSSQALERH